MKVQLNSNYSIQKQNAKNSTPTFNGWNVAKFMPKKPANRFQESMQDYAVRLSYKIGQPTASVTDIVENANPARLAFFRRLVDQYNTRNHYLDGSLKDNPDYIFDIYNLVEKPLQAHKDLVSMTEGSFKYLHEIFSLAKDEKTLMAVEDIQRKILDGSAQSSITIANILKSPNSEEYLKNIENYASYLKLNNKSQDAIQKLDELVASGKYDRKQYDMELNLIEEGKKTYMAPVLQRNGDFIKENYTKEGVHFLDKLYSEFMYHNKIDDAANISEIMDMYKTITPENFNIRETIIDLFKYESCRMTNASKNSKELSEMKELFDKIDSDPNVRKFVEKAIARDLRVDSITELNEIINSVPLKKANIFFNNLKRIVSLCEGDERKTALIKELENPFFEPETGAYERAKSIHYGFTKPENKLLKFKRYLENRVNLYLYNRAVKAGEITEAKPIKHEVNFTIPETTELKPQVTQEIKPKLNIVKTTNSVAEGKYKVISDVNNLIKEKLGAKTLERQQELYTQKATKMRLKLLPDIFASIKETKRTNGSTVSNRDAVRLYSRINGKNRKLVRYMLLKRTSDNTRMFDVRDIIRFIDNADKQIANNKKLNPAYRASDAKDYYNTLYTQIVEENGKLRKSKEFKWQ